MATDVRTALLNQLRPRTSVPNLHIRNKPRIGSRRASERASKKIDIVSRDSPGSPCSSLPSPTVWRDTTAITDCYNLQIQEQLISEVHQLQSALETNQERTNGVLTANEALHVKLNQLQEIIRLLENEAESRLHSTNLDQNLIITSLQSRVVELSSEVDQLRAAHASAVLDLDVKTRDVSFWQKLVHQLRAEKSALEASLAIRDYRLSQKERQVDALINKAAAAAQYHKFVIQEMMLKQHEHGQSTGASRIIDCSERHSVHGRSLSLDAAMSCSKSLFHFATDSSACRCAEAGQGIFLDEPAFTASRDVQRNSTASLATRRQSCFVNEASLEDELSVLAHVNRPSDRIRSIIADNSEHAAAEPPLYYKMVHTSSRSLPSPLKPEGAQQSTDVRPHTSQGQTGTIVKSVLNHDTHPSHSLDSFHTSRGRERVSQHDLYSVHRQSFLRYGSLMGHTTRIRKNKYTLRPCSTGLLLSTSINEKDELARQPVVQRSHSLSRLQGSNSDPPSIAELEFSWFPEQFDSQIKSMDLLNDARKPSAPSGSQKLEIRSIISPREPRPTDAYVSLESMPRPNSVAEYSLSTTRSSSIAVEVEAPYNPMSEKITQCLIGSEMYKYVRHKKKSRFAISWRRSNDEQTVRHRRFVLLKPIDLTICWSLNRPMGKTLGMKKYVIDEIHDVEDHSPIPSNTMMHKRSLIILSRGTALKFTCKDAPTHDLWYEVVTHLLRSRNSTLEKAIASIGTFTPIKVPESLPKSSRPPSVRPARRSERSISLASLRTYAQKTSEHACTTEDDSANTILPWLSPHHIYRARNYSAPAQHDTLRASVPLATVLDGSASGAMDDADACSENPDRKRSVERFVVNDRPSAPHSSSRRGNQFTIASLFR